MKPLVLVPNDVLTTPAKPITFFDKRLLRLVKDMEETLLAASDPKGVGLAGPQIGEPYRIFLTKPTDKAAIRVFINPEIIKTDTAPKKKKKKDTSLEGCLSIVHVWGKVNRADVVTLRYQDVTGQTHEETFEGFMATIVQHETDHINGILFTQRVLEQQNPLYTQAKDEDGSEVLREVEI